MKKELRERVIKDKKKIEDKAPVVWDRIIDRLIAKGKIPKTNKQKTLNKVLKKTK